MKYEKAKFVFIACIFLGTISLCWCIYRDIQIEKQYPGDLRNRIVGSRLQMDGVSPYFYHWKPSDGVRYYDPANHYPSLNICNITSSPFYLQLFYPIANLPQRIISKVWLCIEYLSLFLMTLLAWLLAKENRQKWAVLVVSLFFLYTNTWLKHIDLGQTYIIIPLLAMSFYFFISRRTMVSAALAGICAVSLILIRPPALLFFLPFLLLINQYSRKFKYTFLLNSALVLLLAFGSSQSRKYWADYRKALPEHIRIHQNWSSHPETIVPVNSYANWEGLDTVQIHQAIADFPYKIREENGNLFIFLNWASRAKTPVWALSILCTGFISLILFFFTRRYRKALPFNISAIALAGFCIYMASDILSPVHRGAYYAVQWIFPLLLIASSYSPSLKKIFIIGIFAGLLLMSLGPSIISMQNTLGEYLVFASTLGILFSNNPERAKMQTA